MSIVPHPAATNRRPEAPKLLDQLRCAIRLITRLEGIVQLVVLLLYGTGMRILECLRLRFQDVDFDLGVITIRDGKGIVSPVDVLNVESDGCGFTHHHPSR